MELIIKFEDVDNTLPEKNKFLLIKTEYCNYPAIIGFYNGKDFICSIDKLKIQNVNFWAYLNL